MTCGGKLRLGAPLLASALCGLFALVRTSRAAAVMGDHAEVPPKVLCLPGPEFSYDFGRGEFAVGGTPLFIEQEGGQGRGTAWSVWDGAVATVRYLEDQAAAGDPGVLAPHPRRAVELGSGTGLAGIGAAAALKLPVTLTDLHEALPALERNVAKNPALAEHLQVKALDWLSPDVCKLEPPYGLVLATDTVWVEELIEPFVGALVLLSGPETLVVMGYQSRSTRADALLFGLLSVHFEVKEVQTQRSTRIKIYHMRLRGTE